MSSHQHTAFQAHYDHKVDVHHVEKPSWGFAIKTSKNAHAKYSTNPFLNHNYSYFKSSRYLSRFVAEIMVNTGKMLGMQIY